tara:strand:+ start:876 stop:1796 length:921 start_codon:yes stop_codon:yes gene_type:complete
MGYKQYQQMSEQRGWLNMLRISNSPTIVSNAMVGVAITIHAHAELWSERITPPPLELFTPLILIIAVLLLLYFSGMVFNDAFDAKRDEVSKPDRPIPMGIIRVSQAWSAGFFMLGISILVAFGISVTCGLTTTALGIVILLYTFLHHAPLFSVPLMAICRGMVFIVVVSSFSEQYFSPLLWMYSGALAFYTAVLTFVGTFENQQQSRASYAVWLTLFPAGFIVYTSGIQSPITWGLFIVFTAWIFWAWSNFCSKEKQPVHGMHKLLSGFALLDCIFIAAVGEYHIMVFSLICFALTVAAHRKILGT